VQQVAYSPRNAFFVSLTPKIVGVSFPANRQDLGRYLRSLKRHEKPQVSEYLENAVTLANCKDHIVVALDLGDLFTSRQIRDLLHGAESLAGKEVDLDAITKVIASIKGVTFAVAATDRLNGKMSVDFGESPSPLNLVAKAMRFEAIEKNGTMLDDEIKNWRVIVEAKAVTLEGRLSTKGLRKLTDLIPFPTETVALNEASTRPGETGPASDGSPPKADSKAKKSKKYFQHVNMLVDSMRTDAKNAGSPKLARMMVDKAALEIDRLPVLNVDEDLIAYGAGVSETFRNMRNLSKNASLDASYRQASIAGNQGYGYGYGGLLWRRNESFPLRIGDAKARDRRAQVEPDGDLHHARGEDGGDPQEDDAQVPDGILILSGCYQTPTGGRRLLVRSSSPGQPLHRGSCLRRSRRNMEQPRLRNIVKFLWSFAANP
jgi:hypothetical protein